METQIRHVEQTVRLEQDADYRDHDFESGDHHWQGDIAIQYINQKPPTTGKWEHGFQLAPGTTQGSRHVLAENAPGTVDVLKIDGSPLDGPIIVARDEFTVTHPEHRNATFPAGVYRVQYQRQYAEELRRVVD